MMTKGFSSSSQIRASKELLESITTPECPNCYYGIKMCHHTPCLGTVEDIEKLINAGYSDKLMLDWWVGRKEGGKNISEKGNPFPEDVPYLIPAIIDLGGKKAPFIRTGSCIMLIDNKCSLHDKGLKPTQGRFACCKVERFYEDEEGVQHELDERIPIIHTWNSQRGKDLIKRWKKEVGYNEEKDEEGSRVPNTLPDIIDSLFKVLSGREESHKRTNLPQVSEEEEQRKNLEKRFETYRSNLQNLG